MYSTPKSYHKIYYNLQDNYSSNNLGNTYKIKILPQHSVGNSVHTYTYKNFKKCNNNNFGYPS